MPAPSKCISIHVWGGLGSQLFAVALSLDLKKTFPSRHSVLKLHTSGVTSRISEIDSIFPEFESIQISDFEISKKRRPSEKRSILSTYKRLPTFLVGKLLRFFGFISTCDTDSAFARLKPWVISTRGHYAYRGISLSTFTYLFERLTVPSNQRLPAVENNGVLAVHYRLGDLTFLADKNPVAVDRVGLEIQRFVQTWNPSKIVLYSDSPEDAGRFLKPYSQGAPMEVRSLPASEVIREACQAKYFIGSNSKISFWVVGLRVLYSPALQNSLPKDNQVNWIQCSDLELDYSSISEY
jgi:hypothetical protein